MKKLFLAGDSSAVYYELPNAACRGKSTQLFFSQEQKVIRQAKRICRECPERERCFEMASINHESAGVWGGVVFRRGRPDPNDVAYWENKKQQEKEVGENTSGQKGQKGQQGRRGQEEVDVVFVIDKSRKRTTGNTKSSSDGDKAKNAVDSKAEKTEPKITAGKKGKVKNGRSREDGFSRYPVPKRTVL